MPVVLRTHPLLRASRLIIRIRFQHRGQRSTRSALEADTDPPKYRIKPIPLGRSQRACDREDAKFVIPRRIEHRV